MSPRQSRLAFAFVAFTAWLILRTGPLDATAGLQSQPPTPQPPAASMSDDDIEQFLLKAKVLKTRGIGKGITGSIRATLSDGTITHDAQIQMIDEAKREFRSISGVEFNFRDSWMFNVAAYRPTHGGWMTSKWRRAIV
jgi:hypothetical protein